MASASSVARTSTRRGERRFLGRPGPRRAGRASPRTRWHTNSVSPSRRCPTTSGGPNGKLPVSALGSERVVPTVSDYGQSGRPSTSPGSVDDPRMGRGSRPIALEGAIGTVRFSSGPPAARFCGSRTTCCAPERESRRIARHLPSEPHVRGRRIVARQAEPPSKNAVRRRGPSPVSDRRTDRVLRRRGHCASRPGGREPNRAGASAGEGRYSRGRVLDSVAYPRSTSRASVGCRRRRKVSRAALQARKPWPGPGVLSDAAPGAGVGAPVRRSRRSQCAAVRGRNARSCRSQRAGTPDHCSAVPKYSSRSLRCPARRWCNSVEPVIPSASATSSALLPRGDSK